MSTAGQSFCCVRVHLHTAQLGGPKSMCNVLTMQGLCRPYKAHKFNFVESFGYQGAATGQP